MIHQYTDCFEAGVPLQHLRPSVPLIQRFIDAAEAAGVGDSLTRGELTGDAADEAIRRLIAQINRGLTSATSAFPVRENLEAEAHVLSPIETPLRNMLPRTPGAGLATQWRQLSAFGSGLATLATTTGTTNSTDTIKVSNAYGFFPGETINYQGTTPFTVKILSINYSTGVLTLPASTISSNSQESGKSVVKTSFFYPEQGAAQAIFYDESGAPESSTESYVNKSLNYKLLGNMGDITLFAMAAGENFQNQYAVAKRNCLYRTMLKEEYALLHSQTGVTAKPWGDGTTALGYLGLIPFIQANSPAAQVQTSVGTYTNEHVQTQLTRIHYQGGRKKYILCSGQEAESMTKLATSSGNYRIVIADQKAITLGGKIGAIFHAVSGEEVPIYVHPMLPVGYMVFGALENQMGQPTSEVNVLPQVQDQPGSTFNDNIQGYYAQDIAPTAAAPEVLKFKVGIYQVPKWKNGNVYGLSSGLTSA